MKQKPFLCPKCKKVTDIRHMQGSDFWCERCKKVFSHTFAEEDYKCGFKAGQNNVREGLKSILGLCPNS